MPKAIKKRIPRKKPVEESEVRGALTQALDVIKERQKQFIIGGGAAVVVIILLLIIKIYSSSSYEQAYSVELQANDYYYGSTADKSMPEKERWTKAMELYQKSIDIKMRPTALFYLGNCYFNLGDYDNAIKRYTSFENKFSREEGILPVVYQKLASAYFRTGRNDEAVKALDKLSRLDGGIFKDTALVMEARYYEGAGDREKALEIYRQIITKFPSSLWSGEASAKVSSEEAEAKGPEPGSPPESSEGESRQEQTEAPAAE